MADLTIDYSLTVGEMFLFPLVPAYGLRHLQKEGWENKIVGVIELFPGLGPIAALIEGIVHAIFGKEASSSEKIPSERTSLKERKVSSLPTSATHSSPGTVDPDAAEIADVTKIADPSQKDTRLTLKTSTKTPDAASKESPKDLPIEPALTKETPLTKLKKRAENYRTWKETFKENALAHFQKIQEEGRAEEIAPILSLTPQQQTALYKVVKEAFSCHPGEVEKLATLHGYNMAWVFSLKEIPGWVFKLDPSCDGADKRMVQERVSATQKAKEVIERENLTFLHVPAQQILEFELWGKTLQVLAEQKCDILGGYNKQNGLFHYCTHDDELKPVIQEYVRQLVVLILETGYGDVRHDNNPILQNGQGIALIDMDSGESPISGLRRGCSVSGEDGILWHLTPELIDSVEPLLREKLTPEQFELLHLSEIREAREEAEAKSSDFFRFLNKNKVKTGKELVKWQWAKLPWSDYHTTNLQKRVNEAAIHNFGAALALQEERKFYMAEKPNEEALNKLKKEKKIFDWQRPKFPSLFQGNGYYVYC